MSLAHVDPAGALDAAADPEGAVLALCERGRTALVEAQTVAEGRDVLGMLSTLEHVVKVRDLNAEAGIAASAMRVRAERRVGELIREERERGALAGRGQARGQRSHLSAVGNVDQHDVSTLADVGITRDQAAEYGRLADADAETFEKAVESETDRARAQGGTTVTRAGVLRAVNPEREKTVDARWLEADRFVTACRAVAAHAEHAVTAITFGIYPGDEQLVEAAVDRALQQAADALMDVRRAWDRRGR